MKNCNLKQTVGRVSDDEESMASGFRAGLWESLFINTCRQLSLMGFWVKLTVWNQLKTPAAGHAYNESFFFCLFLFFLIGLFEVY